ncbi:P-loop NTPase fold protein [Alkalibacillus haloalkaliphilus]|uniref:P-loop NTPase fold protein n=1 Tax=Alkalibacillus haloalkaliphilus TaxID=94136 RepID=UPI00293637A1|nr:P-loop NTPase fold protein [Alkalibacillus haloalkaliphilus]MDV2581575.1 P-loop NTPase fold protein [Alkalibacillus haloalkaliphilus]
MGLKELVIKSKDDTEKEYNLYLEDRPTAKDDFDFYQIADSLKETVKETNGAPKHISLMGEWGSGKSTVIQLLKDKLDKKEDKIELKSFSVWKFSDNSTSLQRRIVRQVKKELGYDPSIPLGDESQERETNTSGMGLSAFFLAPFLGDKKIAIATSVLIVLQAVLLTLAFLIPPSWVIYSVPVIALLFSLLSMMGKSKIGISITDKTSINPIEYDDQFEKEFQNTIDEYTKENQLEKLVLVFDDLDRLPPKQLYSALNTIKTFLNSKKCIFIVPCDERVLRNELEYILNTKKFKVDVSEFLNKTFDIIIKLPLVERQNMRRYAKELLEKEKIKWFYDKKIHSDFYSILSILIHSEIDTPRKVKKNLNAFASDWYLAERRDKSSCVSILTDSPKEIAIMSVLKTNYLNFYEILQSKPMFFRGIVDFQELEDKIEKVNLEEMNKDRNAYPLYQKEEIETNEKLDGTSKYEFNISDIVSLQFLKRVFQDLPGDVRPYLYFTNERLNPLTSIEELKVVKESLLNADIKVFSKKFEELDEEQKWLILNNMSSELFGDMDEQNALFVLMNNPYSAQYTTRNLFWEELVRNHFDNINQSVDLANIYLFLEGMEASDLTWGILSEKITKNKDTQTILELWVEFPYSQKKLQTPNLLEAIYDYNLDNVGKEKQYDLSKMIFSLPMSHPICNKMDWKKLIKDTIKGIIKTNQEVNKFNNETDNVDKEKEEIPFNIDFDLIDWINEVNKKSPQFIDGTFLNGLLPLIIDEINDNNIIDGIGEYWEECVNNTDETKEIKAVIDFIADNPNYMDLLFTDNIFTSINGKYKLGLLTEDIEYHSINNLISTLKNEGYEDKLISALDKMKDIKFITDWTVTNYEVTGEPVDKAIEDIIIYNDDKIDLKELFNKLDENFVLNVKNTFISINNIVTSSEVILNYGLNEGYLEKWFLLEPEQTLDIPGDNVELYLGLRSLTEDKEDFKTFLIDEIKYLLRNSYLLENNKGHNSIRHLKFKNSWTEHLGACFIKLTSIGKGLNWSELLDELNNVKLIGVSGSKATTLFEHLDSSIINQAIPSISANSPISNQETNQIILEYSDYENEKHALPIANRWMKFPLEQRKEVIENMSEEFYEEFMEKLIINFSNQPMLSYIDQLTEEKFNSSDKERILNTIVDNAMKEDVGEWIEKMFSTNKSEFNLWEKKAFERVLNIYSSINKLGYTFLKDALTIRNNRTEIALKLIPIMYTQKDAKDARKHIREIILSLEGSEEYSELATKAKRVFKWKNR